MTNMELVLNMLAETSSTEISKSTNSKGFDGAKQSVIKGGNIAKMAKEQLEKETGKKIVSDKNGAISANLTATSDNDAITASYASGKVTISTTSGTATSGIVKLTPTATGEASWTNYILVIVE